MIDLGESYAVITLETWYDAHRDNFQICGASIKYKNSEYGSASVEIETIKYIIDITAWDHASCLDIQIIEKETEISSFPTVGTCETKNIFDNHLEFFLVWFDNEHKSS